MITQLELIDTISKAIAKHGPKNVTVRQMNAVISAVNSILEALGIEDAWASEGMGLSRWRASDDTGLSSLYMVSVIWGGEYPYAHPLDPSDFGRCYRLIRAVPGTREKLAMMADKSHHWKLLVENWDRLERLYEEQIQEEKDHPRTKKHVCWEAMQDIERDAKGGKHESN